MPKNWPGFKLRYRYQNTLYRIAVENPAQSSHGVNLVELDGVSQADKTVALIDDGTTHEVRVVLGEPVGTTPPETAEFAK
jgi:cyclic beta-1,2-glucan synthetase